MKIVTYDKEGNEYKFTPCQQCSAFKGKGDKWKCSRSVSNCLKSPDLWLVVPG